MNALVQLAFGRSGIKEYDGGASWCEWVLFRKNERGLVRVGDAMFNPDNPVEREDLFAALGMEGYGGPPGGSFADRPGCRVSNSYVLVTQRGGLDI